MLSEAGDENSRRAGATPEPAPPVWWARLLARVPLGALYALASFLGWLTFRFFPYREHIVRENLTRAFPTFGEQQLREVMRGYYLGFADMLMEIVKSARMSSAELRGREAADARSSPTSATHPRRFSGAETA